MSLNIDKVKKELIRLGRESKLRAKTKSAMESAPGFNYKTLLFIGDLNSRIRYWLENVNDVDSLVTLNNAIDAFFDKFQNDHFIFTVKTSPIDKNDLVYVDGLVLAHELINVKAPIEKSKISMSLQLRSYGSHSLLNYALMNNCYFYLTGEIEGKSSSGKKYNPTQDNFEEYTENMITSATFTTLTMYCERRSATQELLNTIPF